MHAVLAVLAVLVAFGCGGGKGGGSNKRIVDLTQPEVADMCADAAMFQMPRTISCDGQQVTFGSGEIQGCIDSVNRNTAQFPNCGATEAQFLACARALGSLTDPQICDLVAGGAPPIACAPLATPDCT